MQRNEILETATRKFTEITGVQTKVLHKKLIINRPDFQLEMKWKNRQVNLVVNLKNEIRLHHLPAILNHLGDKKRRWLLICQYIPRPVKDELMKLGINYLEATGNCFIDEEGMFFYINDRPVTQQRKPREGKLWKQAGIKFLFGVLVMPDLLNMPYRKIAEITGVALGNIGTFLQELRDEGFLKEANRNGNAFLFLENRQQLQAKWIELFNTILKPKLKQGTFRFLDKQAQHEWEFLPDTNLYWGGEPAGAKLTNFLVPGYFTLYTNQPKTAIMRQLKLVPDERGNVFIMEQFWHDDLNYKPGLIQPLLAYAELITSLDSRNRETAERIKEKYLD